MMEAYQPIFDAVRSRLSNGDIGQAITEAVREANLAHYVECAATTIAYEAARAAEHFTAPSVLYRPSISIDGNQWCALYGDNLQDGVAGFGDSPAEAMTAFDKAWRASLARGE